MDCTLEEVKRYNEDPRNVDTSQDVALVIDGRTLTMALSSDLQDRFVDLAKHCRTVLCCRVTPLQKSRVVKVVREKLKVMTLAVGKTFLLSDSSKQKYIYIWEFQPDFKEKQKTACVKYSKLSKQF